MQRSVWVVLCVEVRVMMGFVAVGVGFVCGYRRCLGWVSRWMWVVVGAIDVRYWVEVNRVEWVIELGYSRWGG